MKVTLIEVKHYQLKTSYKPVRVSNFWSNDYIEYESNVDRSKTISVEDVIDFKDFRF